MIFTEEFLNEATFTNPVNLQRHYLQHVLQPGEEFNPEDPKFPYMSKEEYAKRAEELSLQAVGDSDNREAAYIGFVVSSPKGDRCIKFKKVSSIYSDPETSKATKKLLKNTPGTFCDLVIYVDDEKRGHGIISYMVGRPGKIYREKRHLVTELDESDILNYSMLDAMRELAKE